MIEVTDLWKSYERGPERKYALTAIELVFPPGQAVGLFGRNGSGKTTLLKCMMKLLPVTSGTIRVDGEKLNYRTFEKLAFLSGRGQVFPDMTVREHREVFCRHFRNFDTKRFQALTELFELPKERIAGNFSEGQRAKLEAALGLCKGAKYLLLDEPFPGNDLCSRNDFLKLLAGLMEEDGIIVIATHFMAEIENFIDRAVFLEKGRLAADYYLEELRREGRSLEKTARELFDYDEEKVMKLI